MPDDSKPILTTFKGEDWKLWAEGYLCDDDRFLQVVKVEFPDKPGRNFLEIQSAYPDGEIGTTRFSLRLAAHRKCYADELREVREGMKKSA